jgi:acyl dehydratase
VTPRAHLYFEDVAVGMTVTTPAMTVTEAHVEIFQGLVRESGEAPGAVPELLPLCLAIGLGWRAPAPPLVVLAFMGFEWEFLGPVRVGDTISSRARIVHTRAMREGGVVVEEREILAQTGETAQRGRFTFLVARRPKEAAA